MGIEDEFMEIINNNNLEDFMSQSESQHMTVKDLHLGIRDLSEALLYITDFIHNFFSIMSENNSEEQRPSLSFDSVMYAKLMFDNAGKFCDSVVASIDDDDDDDDDRNGDTQDEQ